MFRKRRNYLGETANDERDRKIGALETHIQDLERRLLELHNKYLELNDYLFPYKPETETDDH